MTKKCYKLPQNLLSQIMAAQTSPNYWWLLQIALVFFFFYKLQQILLQITAGIANYGVSTNCVVIIWSVDGNQKCRKIFDLMHFF